MTAVSFEFRRISKVYPGQRALDDVSFTLRSGEDTAIIGSSGCGKSTTLRLLAGLESPSAGGIYLNGDRISDKDRISTPPHMRQVAMVFQDLALWPNLSVLENVLLGLSGKKVNQLEALERASEALALSGVEELAFRKPGTLSGGQQQRVALARALAVQPRFLLLDEPFSELDLLTKLKLLDEISALSRDQDWTIVLVTHDPLEAFSLCRFAVVLSNGRVEESGQLIELLKSPRSEMLKQFRRHLSGLPGGQKI